MQIEQFVEILRFNNKELKKENDAWIKETTELRIILRHVKSAGYSPDLDIHVKNRINDILKG